MNFKEFKTEMVSRCKSKSACTTEFKRVLDSENYKELITVLTDNFSWSCNNKIIDIELLEKVGNKTLNKYDLAINVTVIKGFLLVDSATVEAWGSATVEARGSATVKARGSATVKAWDNATVEARGSATVEARGSATVEAGGNATVKAWGSATVKAWDNATVEAWGSATVEARDSATVEAGGNATVKAWDNAYINSFNTTEHKLSNKAICRYYYENKIILSKDSEIEKY